MMTYSQYPVTPCDIAIHASSLWEGFVYRRHSDALFQCWGEGGIELHARMAELAVQDASLCHALYVASEFGFPGVYTYEVTEELGQMLAGHLVSTGNFPDEAQWQTTQAELVLAFFERGNRNRQGLATLRAIVAQHLIYWTASDPLLIPSDVQNPSAVSFISFPSS